MDLNKEHGFGHPEYPNSENPITRELREKAVRVANFSELDELMSASRGTFYELMDEVK